MQAAQLVSTESRLASFEIENRLQCRPFLPGLSLVSRDVVVGAARLAVNELTCPS